MDGWCYATGLERGFVMPLAQCAELGRMWYADRLTSSWKPKTADVMLQIFAEVGLEGRFWEI